MEIEDINYLVATKPMPVAKRQIFAFLLQFLESARLLTRPSSNLRYDMGRVIKGLREEITPEK